MRYSLDLPRCTQGSPAFKESNTDLAVLHCKPSPGGLRKESLAQAKGIRDEPNTRSQFSRGPRS